MRRELAIFGIFFAMGVAALMGYYLLTRPTPPAPITGDLQAPSDAPGPYLVIEVGGEATGVVRIDLNEKDAPQHTQRMVMLAQSGAYDGVAFHRVIDRFMAQTGDVQFGGPGGDMNRAGMGGSDLPDLPAEFSNLPFDRGVVGMARSQNPNSANSQFFIMFAPAPHLNGQYTVVGRVTEGQDIVDAIKRGEGGNGAVIGEPDRMIRVTVEE